MLETNLKVINYDVQVLMKDAQSLFQEAAALTGVKADEVRGQAMQLLDRAMKKAHDMQANSVIAGKEMAASTNNYVRENPWRTVAVAAGAAMLVGVLLGRK